MKPRRQNRSPLPEAFAVFRERRPPVMVVSHERSGTHFLMNSIARGYGYTAKPWVDMDGDSMPINFFHPPAIAGTLAALADRRIAAIIKSHHLRGCGTRRPAHALPALSVQDMLDRWAKHVEGWYRASAGRPRLRLVSYRALRDDYRATLGGFAELLGRKPSNLTPPARDESVIRGGKVDHQPDMPALRVLALAEVGETMRLLGYS
jgi:hypothetical protein